MKKPQSITGEVPSWVCASLAQGGLRKQYERAIQWRNEERASLYIEHYLASGVNQRWKACHARAQHINCRFQEHSKGATL